MRRTFLLSTFDMVNIADLDLLRQAAGDGGEVVVGVLSDELVEQLHGRPAVVPDHERLELVSNLRVTEEVVLVKSLDHLPADARIVTDEPALADRADEVLEPARRSASPELLAALAAPVEQAVHA